MAVGALDTRPVSRLGALTASVTELVAVTALNLSHVAGLRTLLRDMALLVAVAAGDDTFLLALLSTVAFLAAVAADVRLTVGAVAGEVTHLTAVLALNVVHVRRLGALLRDVAFLAAVAATSTATLLYRLLAVASTMADLVAVDTLLNGFVLLTLLLFTFGPSVADFVAIAADDDEAVHRKAGLAKTVDVYLWALRPANGEGSAPGLGRPLEGDGVLLVRLALKVNQSPVDSDFLLLSDKVGVEVLTTEGLLDILERDGAFSLGVGEESLLMC